MLTPDGDVRFFGPLPQAPVPGWVPRLEGEGAGEPSRLKVQWAGASPQFTWYSENGAIFSFRQQDVLGAVWLTEARSTDNVKAYEVQYATVCGQAQPSAVLVGESPQRIEFTYTSCTLQRVAMGNRTLATYSGAVATIPESAQTLTPTPGGWKDYVGLSSKRETQMVNGVAIRQPEDLADCSVCAFIPSSEVRHLHLQLSTPEGPKIHSSAEGWGGALVTTFGNLSAPVTPPLTGACTTTTRQRSASIQVGGGAISDSRVFAWGTVTQTRDFLSPSGLGATYEPLPVRITRQCLGFSDPDACRPSTVEFVYGHSTPDGLGVDTSCGTPSSPTSLVAVRDPGQAFTVTPGAFTSRAGGNFEGRVKYEGAATASGSGALSTMFQTYAYSGDKQQLETDAQLSVLMPGARATTTRQYDSAGRVVALIRSGYTRRADTSVLEHRAVFFRHGSRCSGLVDGVVSDRVTSIQGPCGVSGPAATSCTDPSNVLVTDLYYYDTRTGPPPAAIRFLETATTAFNDGRLALSRTFPNGCGGTELDTKYGMYTAEGQPQRIVNADQSSESTSSSGVLVTHASGPAEATLQTDLDLSWNQGQLQKVRLANGDVWRACYAARNVAQAPPAEQVLFFPHCPLVGNDPHNGNAGAATGGAGRGNGAGSSGGIFHGNGGVGTGKGSGSGNGGVGQGNGAGNLPQGAPMDRMSQPLWIGRFSARGEPREHYSFQYSADRTLARVEFFNDPLPSGAYGPGPTFYVFDNGITRVKPLWTKVMRTDADRLLIASSLSDKIPTALSRDARGDVIAMGSGFDFASPALPAQVSCLSGSNGLCKQLVRDRLGSVAAYIKPAASAGANRVGADVMTFDAQRNVSSYSRGCPVASALPSPLTSVSEGPNGALHVLGGPGCSAVPMNFVHDDFGELVSVTQVVGGQASETRFEYDSRGQLYRRRSAEDRRNPDPSAAGSYHRSDGLGRETLASAHGAMLVQRTFDQFDLPPFCQAHFGVPTFTKGRLAVEVSPVWTTFFTYNELGQVTGELRLKTGLGDCPSRETDEMNITRFSYGYRGRLQEIRYPYGRRVRYGYPLAQSGDDSEKPNSVEVEVFGVAGVAFVPMVTNIRWTRDGLLSSYRALTFSQPASGAGSLQFSSPTFSHTVAYEYAGGADAESPPPSCTTTPSGGSDGTRRLRRITAVSDTQGLLGQEWYTWRADQIVSVDRCYSGMTTPLTQFRIPSNTRGFDPEGQLMESPIPATGSVPSASRTYGYDSLGNRRFVGFGAPLAGSANGSVNSLNGDLVESTRAASVNAGILTHLPNTREAWSNTYDLDGRLIARSTAVDSRGVPNSTTHFTLPYGALPNGGDGAVIRAVNIDGLTFNYYYDGQNRRVRKQYPTGGIEDFFYGPQKQLLSERSFAFTDNSQGNVVDEYIWLNGMVIGTVRTPFTGDMTRAGEWRGFSSADGPVCFRRNEPSRCGLYWVAPDYWGRPLVAVDQNHKVSGVGEYDAFGTMNRVEAQRETPHPVVDQASHLLATGTTRERFQLGLRARVRASFIDTQFISPCGMFVFCVGSVVVRVTSPTESLYFGLLSGSHGPLVTPWFRADAPFDVSVTFGGASDGAAMRAWDYQRVSPPDGSARTSLQYFPPIRLPGQYYDEETDLHENWNRYYDSVDGRYLSPEPLLQSPTYVRRMAQSGMSVPTYPYAANNPLRYADSTGLDLLILYGDPGFIGSTGLNRPAYEASLADKIGSIYESVRTRVHVQSAESGFYPGALSQQPSDLGRWDTVVWVGHGSGKLGLDTKGLAGLVDADTFARWFGGRSPKHITVLGCEAGGASSGWRKETQQLLPGSSMSGFDGLVAMTPKLDASEKVIGINSIQSVSGGPIETFPSYNANGWW